MNRVNHFAMPAFATALGLASLLTTPLENQTAHAANGLVSGATLFGNRAVVAQASHPTAKRQADHLLELGRQAMRDGDLQRAEWYLGQAQELEVSYRGILDRLADTPAKLRGDLDKLKQPSSASPIPPSQKYSPAPSSSQGGSRITASAPAGGPDSSKSSLIRNPYVGTEGPSVGLTRPSPDPLDALVGGAKQQARMFQGDSIPPTIPPPIPTTVTQAMHRETPGTGSEIQQPLGIRKIGTSVPLEQVPQETSPWTGKKEEVLKLLALARAALDRGNWQQAESMTKYAQQLEVPDSAYAEGEMRPWVLMLEIDRKKAQVATTSEMPGNRSPSKKPTAQPVADQSLLSDLMIDAAPDAITPETSKIGRSPTSPDPNTARLVQALQSNDPDWSQVLDGQLSGDEVLSPPPASVTSELSSPSIDQLLDASPFGADNDIEGAPAPFTVPRSEEVSAAPSALPAPSQAMSESPSHRGTDLFEQGERALRDGDSETARQLLLDAYQDRDQLTPEMQQRLQDYLSVLGSKARQSKTKGPATAVVSDVLAEDRAALQDFYRRVTKEMVSIGRLKEDEPSQAWEKLNALRGRVANADIDEDARRQLLSRVDRKVKEMETYVEKHRPIIELEQRNRQMLAEVEQQRKHRQYVQQELGKIVDQFNSLMDEQRYPEAFIVAKQARELDPTNPIVENLTWKSQFARQMTSSYHRQQDYQRGAMAALDSIEGSSVPFNDDEVISFGKPKYWEDLTQRRQKMLRDQQSRFSTAEIQIQKSLNKKVDVSFDDQSLTSVMDTLGRLAGINIFLDPQGLSAEGIPTDERVTIQLRDAVSLKSALNLILRPLRLSYIIEDEVLRVTSESVRDADVFPHTYTVADLVIPIPSFNPNSQLGLAAAIRDAYQSQSSQGLTGQFMANNQNQNLPMTMTADAAGGASNQSALAQLGASGQVPGFGGGGQTPFGGVGPSGQGGGAQADFDTLIELITTTIEPTTWDEVGGTGSIAPFDTNLSIVVSQTQEVHEKIADLLEQLRRLQDLQVTIEVRFITLNDNFFERIGIDFDFDIDDNTGLSAVELANNDDDGPSITVGLDPSGAPTLDLDVPFTQGSFGATVPSFGGFDPASAANFGFAILSDIEAFFVIQAAQGDRRTNILQAPKVTLFNGQNAVVSDTSQRPFVTTVIPVVGDFAAAHQPIITVLTEGTSLSVQAVVSPDRRFVRLTMVPFFSRIGDVDTFTFNGRTTSNSGTIAIDPADDGKAVANNEETVTEGTTVQLPTFSFTTVTTTVSVPDGGTILLGGIKRLSEGRDEQGVPMLSKLPYINRLFKNVGIGRETQSLMMMVTPRIIIQEEEEDKLGLALP